MSSGDSFELWALASHPLVQQLAHLDWEIFDEIYHSHPAVAHFIDATMELVEAAEVWRLDGCE